MFELIYLNRNDEKKSILFLKFYLPKGIIKNYKININGKTFFDEIIHSGIKRYRKIKRLITGKGENYTTGCLLDYDYIENHYRLIALDLSRQRRSTKIRNTIAKNASTNIKHSKVQLSKMIQSVEFLRNILGNLGKKVITDRSCNFFR